jgi:pyruvate formate lyase activating enzyme
MDGTGPQFGRRDLLKCLLGSGIALGLRGLAGCTGFAGSEPSPAWVPTVPPASHELRFYRALAEDTVQCQICFRNCVIPRDRLGDCHNVKNIAGRAFSLVHSRPCALQVDPIEKEPAFHVLPGSHIFCTGTASCNFSCKFCHNWEFAQQTLWEVVNLQASPQQIVRQALKGDCAALSFTYNDPIVFYDYMLDVLEEARETGLYALCHTNGTLNEKPLQALLGCLDAVVVDLKGFSDAFYQKICGAALDPVLRALEQIRRSDTHLEIVHLVIPTLNDDLASIRRMCRWIAGTLGVDVPLHLLRFFPSYRLQRLPDTPIETLERAAETAQEQGLQYVYIGNVPGHRLNSTYCPRCGQRVIERIQFTVLGIELEQGACRFCGQAIPGVWRT